MKIKLKRVYAPREKNDGRRILVERLWPRGLTREAAGVDIWMKEVSPSPALRQWFAHDPEKWPEFKRRYLAELALIPEAVAALRAQCADGATFLFAAKDEEKNSAVLLKAFLDGKAR